jgi:glycosyltransferase involved in cell wall biosynthesis
VVKNHLQNEVDVNGPTEIVHFGKYYWPECGGMETAAKSLAELGAELGYQVSCVVSGTQIHTTSRERLGDVEVIRHPQAAKLLSAPISPQLLWHPLRNNPVVHLHLPHPIAELAILRTLLFGKKIKLVPYFHAMPVRQGRLGRLWFNTITAKILDHSDRILISNERIVAAFPTLERWKEKLKVLPFFAEIWSDTQFEEARKARASSRDVFAIGRLVPYKGFDVLIRAWAEACRQSATVRTLKLQIAGEGPERENLRALIETEGLSEQATLIGRCTDEEKEAHFKTSFLVAAPSVTDAETFGISILEAQARGLPVITTTLTTGVSLLSRGGACGASVAPGRVVELAQAIVSLCERERAALSEIGARNLRFARENFSKKNCQDEYQRILGKT